MSDDDYECFCCGERFTHIVWGLNRSVQRVHFTGSIPDVETRWSDGLACYCSVSCLEAGTPSVMADQMVPIPTVFPDIGPVEACALCKAPVDMTEWHVAYGQDMCKAVSSFVMQPVWGRTIAVLCKRCGEEQNSLQRQAPTVALA